jgi:hypothetical protein
MREDADAQEESAEGDEEEGAHRSLCAGECEVTALRATALTVILGMLAIAPAAAQADFGIESGSATIEALESDGSPATQAGSHPYALTLHFKLNTEPSGATEGGQMRDFRIKLPPGLIGNPTAVPVCPRQSFEGVLNTCPPSTQVGVVRAILPGTGEAIGPLYNLAPAPGSAAQFGFDSTNLVALSSASVLTDENYAVRAETANLPTEVSEVTATLWGTPADPTHKAERGPFGGELSEATPVVPFLTLPTSCVIAPEALFEIDSKINPGVWVGEGASLRGGGIHPQALTGCDAVPFAPEVLATATARSAESASGLDFALNLPDQGLLNPIVGAVAETQPTKTVVTLPEGVTANPAAAAGLGVCSKAQLAQASPTDPGCPPASKLGTLEAHSPLLEESIQGAVYLATPHANKFGSLLALYIVAAAPQRGVLVKQEGRVVVDPRTGRLTTTIEGLPPIPYSSFQLRLREGPRAPLITPQGCGSYAVKAELFPFSGPTTATAETAPFKITSGANGGACASGEAGLPNAPEVSAGSTSTLAGAYSPFVFRLSRQDGTQRFSTVSLSPPKGLLGRLAGIPYCPQSGIDQAQSRSAEGDGAVELASPSCPAASQVGTVSAGAGAGPLPYSVQGKVYLAGPYKGAPLSLEIITPAIAGPFDLGVVAVRTALYVDQTTAQIRAVSDPLPTILDGIPLDVRAISLQMDKAEFTLNPTNCNPQTIAASVTSLAGSTAALSTRFAVGGCKGLEFKPNLKLLFSGQTKRTGFPAIKAVLTQPPGENANVAATKVILPKGMLIANAHINNPCTRVQFNFTPVPGEGCPGKSVLGTAKVWTPLLEKPEEGKVYFRSNGGERQLPDLVIALRGQVPLQLVGFIDSVGKKGAEVRRVRARFLSVPDAPVSRFELKMLGGKRGLLQNSKNLCKAQYKANVELTGQNGKTHGTEPKVQVTCSRAGGKNKKK